ncbi:MAG: hypothetical protein AAGE59_10945 [Cyanobacteria bacterium P01_F01_bin.86]
MKRRWKILIVIAAMAAVSVGWVFAPYAYIFAAITWDAIAESKNETAFSSEVWQDDARIHAEPFPRINMIDHLLQQYEFVGWQESEVLKLLGEPTDTEYFQSYDLVYWLGPERGFISIDSEWLVIKLDDNKIVQEVLVLTD